MNHRTSIFLGASLLLFLAPARAQTDTATEFTRLQKDQQQAIKAALEPLNRRYIEALQQLLRRSTASGDLDTAVKVREELKHLGVTMTASGASSGADSAATEAAAAKTFEMRITGSTWTFPWEGGVQTIRLAEGGKLVLGWSKTAPRTWRVLRDGVIELAPYSSAVLETMQVHSSDQSAVLTRKGKTYPIQRVK